MVCTVSAVYAVLERRLLQRSRAAHVARERATAADGEHRAGNHDADCLDVAPCREDVQYFPGHDVAGRDALRVNDWRLAGDGDRLFDRAAVQVGCD